MTTRAMVGAFVEDRTDANGVITTDSFSGLARRMGFRAQPWEAVLKVCARPALAYTSDGYVCVLVV